MQTKEYLLVGAVAVLLTNLSIVATLFATGYFGDSAAEEVVIEEPPATEEIPPPEPPQPKVLHSMAKAMYTCEDKLLGGKSNTEIGYQFDTVASRYSPEEEKYIIFIETHTTSRSDAPQKDSSIICEVSDSDLSVKGWKVLPL